MVRPQGRLRPNLLLIGNPKTGSTFLFNCLRSGPFDPNLLCGSDSSMWKSCHKGCFNAWPLRYSFRTVTDEKRMQEASHFT